MNKSQKPYVVIGDRRKMTKSEWLELRRKSIGGSDAGTIAGLNKFSSPLAVFLDKKGIVDKSQMVKSADQQEKMHWGNLLESVIREEFSRVTGMKTQELFYILKSANPNVPIIANVDGICFEEDGTPCILEIKTAGEYAKSDYENDGIPASYYAQCMHYMYVTGLKRAYLACLIAGQKLVIRKINRDDDVIDYMLMKDIEFWNCIKTNTPPKAEDTDNMLLNALYPQSNAQSISLDTAYSGKLDELCKIKEEISTLKKQQEHIEAELKQAMGSNELATVGNFKISWKTASRSSFSADKAKELLTEDQIAACTVTTSTRTLRISQVKPAKN